ncbi:MAG: hypothetical protein ABG776_04360, partial [Cyanobacteria bacterium J06555_13]
TLFGPRILLSNLVKNLSLHFSTPVPSINSHLEAVVNQFHQLIGVPIIGPQATSDFFWFSSLITHEDMAGNFMHLMLIAIAFILFWFHQRVSLPAKLTPYVGSILSAFLLFCILVKFQQFNSRHHLFFFVALSPFVGMVLAQVLRETKVKWFTLFLVVCALPWLFFNELRPVVINSQIIKTGNFENIFYLPREKQYFLNRSDLNTPENPYIRASDVIAKAQCSTLGLSLKSPGTASHNNWEYPFWVLLRNNGASVTELQHLNVDNYSKPLMEHQAYQNFSPECILAIEKDAVEEDLPNLAMQETVTYDQKVFKKLWSQDSVSVFQQ